LGHLVFLWDILWGIFPRVGMLHQVKSGNPALQPLEKDTENYSQCLYTLNTYVFMSNFSADLHFFDLSHRLGFQKKCIFMFVDIVNSPAMNIFFLNALVPWQIASKSKPSTATDICTFIQMYMVYSFLCWYIHKFRTLIALNLKVCKYLNSLVYADFPVQVRVARWFLFKTKIQNWANFGGPWTGKCWYIL
jgi:hypothetical protein